MVSKQVIMTNLSEVMNGQYQYRRSQKPLLRAGVTHRRRERFLIRRRERPAAVLISTADLERLERGWQAARRLALALGQSAELMQQIEAKEIHPAMAAFGLWRDETDLDGLADEIDDNRRRQAPRPGMSL